MSSSCVERKKGQKKKKKEFCFVVLFGGQRGFKADGDGCCAVYATVQPNPAGLVLFVGFFQGH